MEFIKLLQYHWATTNKTPWFILTAIILALAGFAWYARSIIAAREEARSLLCLAMNVYFEARGEPLTGQQAVAEVTLNRVASGLYPGTVCGVVFQKNWDPLRGRYVGAFSWTEFDEVATPQGTEWLNALQVAESVYRGSAPRQVQGALHYHAVHIRPSWAQERHEIARIGKHLFYGRL